MLEYRIIRREEKYAEGIADLLNTAFSRPGDFTAEKIIDKHFTNPVGGGVTGMAAFDGEKVVGIEFFMSGEHLHDGRIYRSALSCDAAVHPDYQGQRIFQTMQQNMEDYFRDEGYDFLTGFPNNKSRTAHVRNGWTEVFVFDYNILLCPPPKAVSDIFLGSGISRKAKAAKKAAQLSVGGMDIISPRDYAAIGSIRDKFHMRRSPELYAFKFHDKYHRHRYVKVSEGGDIKLLMVAREDRRKFKGINLTFMDIVDYIDFADSDSSRMAYIALALDNIRRYGHAAVIWQQTDTYVNEMLLAEFRFKNLTKMNIGKSEHYYFVKPLNASVPDSVTKPEGWHLQWIETDL
ncbi:MAG: GNAT family N-acetyltransferase [Clostridiales Family XIII bacterium]|jgi:GNAT superfamily N-acetyltransferase|nr:GNAT family N-acetyltransferase [Clostridiales Family XIII bacterium]